MDGFEAFNTNINRLTNTISTSEGKRAFKGALLLSMNLILGSKCEYKKTIENADNLREIHTQAYFRIKAMGGNDSLYNNTQFALTKFNNEMLSFLIAISKINGARIWANNHSSLFPVEMG